MERGATVVLVPARRGSSRLPDKVLADIGGEPMIVHVLRRAIEAGVGDVIVAAAETEIACAVQAAGGRAALTRPGHPSGSDRICEALAALDPGRRYEYVVNLQGDLPTIEPAAVRAALAALAETDADLATVCAEIRDPAERADPNIVKLVAGFGPGARRARALYFTRATAPAGDGPLYHHIGLYAWRRAALERFVSLPPSVLETRERLEQLRALEAGMRIEAALADTVPLGVDTAADLERARALLARESGQ